MPQAVHKAAGKAADRFGPSALAMTSLRSEAGHREAGREAGRSDLLTAARSLRPACRRHGYPTKGLVDRSHGLRSVGGLPGAGAICPQGSSISPVPWSVWDGLLPHPGVPGGTLRRRRAHLPLRAADRRLLGADHLGNDVLLPVMIPEMRVMIGNTRMMAAYTGMISADLLGNDVHLRVMIANMRVMAGNMRMIPGNMRMMIRNMRRMIGDMRVMNENMRRMIVHMRRTAAITGISRAEWPGLSVNLQGGR